MRRAAVALRHLCFEDAGLLDSILARHGFDLRYCEAPIDAIDTNDNRDVDLLVVLGGPISAYEADRYPFLSDELRLIERRLQRDRATLGICLGAQLIAAALGAKVYPGPAKEIGWGEIVLTEAGRASALAPLAKEGAKALHWHGDTFDPPACATRLASTTLYENQAFQYERDTLALQFHLEADPARIEQWLVGHAGELAAEEISLSALRAQAVIARANAATLADAVFSDWLTRISTEPHAPQDG